MSARGSAPRWLKRIGDLPAGFRSREARAAFSAAVLDRPSGAVCISVGGGPTLVHPRLLNLNLFLLPNVDVVGSAYALPFRDESVDSVYCEAVLEHLEQPQEAVAEMHRALKLGGQVLAATPFLQPFHGYPDHFQNFTLSGHVRLFERGGFRVLAAGACVGPSFAILDMTSNYLREFLPGRFLSRGAFYLARLLGAPCLLLDRFLLRYPAAHVLASSTFVHCTKRKGTRCEPRDLDAAGGDAR
jgi:SAM-dependent methyltransferase